MPSFSGVGIQKENNPVVKLLATKSVDYFESRGHGSFKRTFLWSLSNVFLGCFELHERSDGEQGYLWNGQMAKYHHRKLSPHPSPPPPKHTLLITIWHLSPCYCVPNKNVIFRQQTTDYPTFSYVWLPNDGEWFCFCCRSPNPSSGHNWGLSKAWGQKS